MNVRLIIEKNSEKVDPINELTIHPLADEIKCDDDSGSGRFSRLQFDATVNTSYAIVVDSYYTTDEGPIEVRIRPCAPADWDCAEGAYDSGDGCDCGCGVIDPDCDGDESRAACDTCNGTGSCARFASCNAISAGENFSCN